MTKEEIIVAMHVIYDPQRDYEMCYYDLEAEDKLEYDRLKALLTVD